MTEQQYLDLHVHICSRNRLPWK